MANVFEALDSPGKWCPAREAGRVRLYCPYGHLLEGMAYLVRRLLENTSNESALRLTFAHEADQDRLLENPRATLERIIAQGT